MPFSILLLSYFLFHKILVWNGRCFKILKAFPGLDIFFWLTPASSGLLSGQHVFSVLNSSNKSMTENQFYFQSE